MTKPIVTIGLPTGDYFTIVRNTALDFMKMIAYTMNNGICEKVQMESAASVATYRNRNSLVGAMWEESEFLLQIDADMTFPEDTLERMLKSYEKIYEEVQQPFVLTGLGFMGTPPYFPALFHAVRKHGDSIELTSAEKTDNYDGWVPVTDISSTEPFEVDACGSFGFLVPYKIFSAFKGYGGWFNHHIEMDPENQQRFLEIRHDLAFSMRVREAGFKIFCDPTIEFGHIRPRPIKKEIWNAHVKEKNLTQEKELSAFRGAQFRARHIQSAFGEAKDMTN